MTGLNTVVQAYHDVTVSFSSWTGAPDKVLHVHVGLGLLILLGLALRRPIASWRPLIALCAVEALNELMDRLFWGGWRWSETLPDVVNTLAWPLLLVVAVEIQRRLMARR